MRVPEAFRKFSSYFYAYSAGPTPELPEMAAFARSHLTQAEITIVKNYIDELLATPHTKAELQQIWWHSGARIVRPRQKT